MRYQKHCREPAFPAFSIGGNLVCLLYARPDIYGNLKIHLVNQQIHPVRLTTTSFACKALKDNNERFHPIASNITLTLLARKFERVFFFQLCIIKGVVLCTTRPCHNFWCRDAMNLKLDANVTMITVSKKKVPVSDVIIQVTFCDISEKRKEIRLENDIYLYLSFFSA